MLDKHIDQYAAERPGKSPMFYADIHYAIRVAKKFYHYKAEGIVCKGTESQIKESTFTKKRVLFQYFGGEKTAKKKVKDFDLDRVKVHEVKPRKFLGYGAKL